MANLKDTKEKFKAPQEIKKITLKRVYVQDGKITSLADVEEKIRKEFINYLYKTYFSSKESKDYFDKVPVVTGLLEVLADHYEDIFHDYETYLQEIDGIEIVDE